MREGLLVLVAPLASCDGVRDCLPEPLSAERQALRADLRAQAHFSQCPGRPSPSSFDRRITAYYARKEAFLRKVQESRFSADLLQARREDEEASRLVNEADCMIYPEEMANEPENIRAFEAEFSARERQLAEAERRFDVLNRACIGAA